jgi:glycosyltransferase involved in cell wall biosynthesis
MDVPRITVVTPSLNQGQFLEETIQSVIAQRYPNLEYIIIDGGSTDNSVAIIKRYEHHLAYWVSEPDAGQSAAINKGFAMATGDILAWLNSDDMYMMGALAHIAAVLADAYRGLIFGNSITFADDASFNPFGSNVMRDHAEANLELVDYIVQPSTFCTRDTWLRSGPLDESLVFAFDWDWFIRARKLGIAFRPLPRYLSLYRLHGGHKTGTGGDARLQEIVEVYRRHAGARYGAAFLDCNSRRSQRALVQRWIRRFRLGDHEMTVLRLCFPRIFGGLSAEEIRDVLRMG